MVKICKQLDLSSETYCWSRRVSSHRGEKQSSMSSKYAKPSFEMRLILDGYCCHTVTASDNPSGKRWICPSRVGDTVGFRTPLR
jgi:hypothetical protein